MLWHTAANDNKIMSPIILTAHGMDSNRYFGTWHATFSVEQQSWAMPIMSSIILMAAHDVDSNIY
jgi:hypothetical protein